MIGAVFHYEQVLQQIIPLYDQLLDRIAYNARNFGATHLFIIDGTSGNLLQEWLQGYSDSGIIIEIFNSLEDIENMYQDYKFVYLENKKTLDAFNCPYVDIKDYVHPENAIYVAGQIYTPLENWLISRITQTWLNISIEDMFSDTATLIALYERNRG